MRSDRLKSGIDRVVALLALLVLSPALIAIALAILVTDGRPLLFVQARTGRNGRSFGMYKFRTMVRNAIEVGQQLGLSEDPFAIVQNDPRITRVGRFLRRTSLDELPQLVNVLRGDMSLVGPRPDVPEQAVHYNDEERVRLLVKPGITGWAQVHGRENLTWPERFALDTWYVHHRSVWLDLKIIVKTFAQFTRSDESPVPDDFNIARRRERGQG